MKQSKINKMLSSVRSSRDVYNTYGQVIKVSWFHIVAFLDTFIPTARVPTMFAYKYLRQKELMRITIK